MSRHAFGYRFGHRFRGAGATAVSADVPWPWDVAIGGHTFLVDWAQYQWQIIDPFRQGRDVTLLPGEWSLNPESSWKRTRNDWRHGAGQAYADDGDSDGTRFASSKGIDWTVDRQLQLLHETENASASTHTNLRVLYVGGVLYMLDGAVLRYTASPHASPIVWTNITLAGNGLDLTTDGNLVYVALDGAHGVYSYPIGSSSPTHMGGAAATDVAQLLEYCNGFLVAGIANTLTGISTAGAHQQPFVHPVAGGTWTAAVGAPNAIYAAFVANDISLIYRMGVDNTGALAVPILATPMPVGETVHALGFYDSRLLVGTNKGVRVGEIAADGSVALGPRIANGADVRAFASWDALTAFGWGAYDATSSGLGVMRLADLVAANQPAWSSWLLTPDTSAVEAPVTAVAMVDGDAWFCVSGSGLWRPSASYVPSGALHSGPFTFGVHEAKQWASLEVVTAPLDGSIGAQLINDDGTIFDFGLLSVQRTLNIGTLLSATGQAGEQADVVFTLHRDASGLKTPIVRRATLRGLPNPVPSLQWDVPLILRTEVSQNREGEGQALVVDVAAEVRFLKGLNRSLRAVRYQEAHDVQTVQVRGIAIPQGAARGYAKTAEAIEGTYVVTLVAPSGN